MAKIYQITEAEMNSLFDRLRLESMQETNVMFREDDARSETKADIHRAFHFVCVNWAQEMGFVGYRK